LGGLKGEHTVLVLFFPNFSSGPNNYEVNLAPGLIAKPLRLAKQPTALHVTFMLRRLNEERVLSMFSILALSIAMGPGSKVQLISMVMFRIFS